ncbi:16S ribosomal RNA m2G1207 methyltransferase [Actinobacillus equuli]|nr:16S ribosomal RNA m2G1207 methyltransferase [Actinobacillus equuli]
MLSLESEVLSRHLPLFANKSILLLAIFEIALSIK